MRRPLQQLPKQQKSFLEIDDMKFWTLILTSFVPCVVGISMNLVIVKMYGGKMPLSFPWGDWIPLLGSLCSIGDILIFFALALAMFIFSMAIEGLFRK